jgi:REP element-mobilizing transposase RayT
MQLRIAMKNDYVSSGRSISDMKAHLVLTTKYRRKAFTGEMLKRLQEILFDRVQIEIDGQKENWQIELKPGESLVL